MERLNGHLRIKHNSYTYWIDRKAGAFIYRFPGMDNVYYYFDDVYGKDILENGTLI